MLKFYSWLLLGLLAIAVSADEHTCPVEEQDERVYMFAYGTDLAPFMDINSDNKLVGLNYDVTRAICKEMKKKCEHVVFYDYDVCWDTTYKSIGLNDRWWDVCTGYMQLSSRRSAYGFVANFAKEPPSYLYVRNNDRADTVNEINRKSTKIAFHTGWWINPACLEKQLGVQVNGREQYFNTTDEMKEALADGAVDAMFGAEVNIGNDSRFKRVNQEQVLCAHAGQSFMMRKDNVENMMWLEEGLRRIRANGDYDYVCRINQQFGETGCL